MDEPPQRYVTRHLLQRALQEAIEQACRTYEWKFKDTGEVPPFWVKRAANGRGEFASNVALVLGAATGMAPQRVIETLRLHTALEHYGLVRGVAIEEAKGFLNFRLDDNFLNEQAARAVREGARYGAGSTLAGRRINVEFVSADPTGPLSISYGRIAAVGEALCRVLEFHGADVTREFFLNDVETSSKMRLLGESVAAFYLAAFGRGAEWPEGALQDSFVRNVAETIVQREGTAYLLVPDSERAAAFAREACASAVARQKQTLQDFGVRFDVWTSENALSREGRITGIVNKLRERGHTYERDRAVWLRTTKFSDEADRPLVRANGQPTYLAADIAYHAFKMERGFDLVLNIWTAQHRPYVLRTRAALEAAGYGADKLEVLLCEGVRFLRDGVLVTTGKGGEPITLGEALREIDRDTLHFLFLNQDWDEVIEVETEVVRRDDESNPAYAARLVPSRLGTMIRELEAQVGQHNGTNEAAETANQLSDEEREVLRLVAVWPDEVETAVQLREPQRIAGFLGDLASTVRRLLAASRPHSATPIAAQTRLQLLRAAQITAVNALHLLGIEANSHF
ncbi:MAG: arginine--tRNA ligase [Abitibacteriaceae bacterium]|nr:arginine--tRNA ligase [Abditibacteriaceae bacterium]